MRALILIPFFLTTTVFGQSDTLNTFDANGQKQGYWIVYGRDKPEKGYPEMGIIEEGRYVDDRKTGEWIIYYGNGVAPKLKGTFVNGRPNGPYIKYWQNGNIKEIGNFALGRQKGDHLVYYESGCLSRKTTYISKDTSIVENFLDDCSSIAGNSPSLESTEGTRIDSNYNIHSGYTSSDCGTTIGSPYICDSKIEFDPLKLQSFDDNSQYVMYGLKFHPNGYNKVYSKGEISFDGEFKDSSLWDGKLYHYDSDGILEKIEIWREGKFCCLGEL